MAAGDRDLARVADMARTGRPKAELILTDGERATLQRWARRPKSAQALALRAKIVLACAEGKDNKDGGRAAAGPSGHGGQVAVAVHHGPAGRAHR